MIVYFVSYLGIVCFPLQIYTFFLNCQYSYVLFPFLRVIIFQCIFLNVFF